MEQIPQRLTQPQKAQKKRKFFFPVFLHTSGKTNSQKNKKQKKPANLWNFALQSSQKNLCEKSEKMSYNQCCSGIRFCTYQEVLGINSLHLKIAVGFQFFLNHLSGTSVVSIDYWVKIGSISIHRVCKC